MPSGYFGIWWGSGKVPFVAGGGEKVVIPAQSPTHPPVIATRVIANAFRSLVPRLGMTRASGSIRPLEDGRASGRRHVLTLAKRAGKAKPVSAREQQESEAGHGQP